MSQTCVTTVLLLSYSEICSISIDENDEFPRSLVLFFFFVCLFFFLFSLLSRVLEETDEVKLREDNFILMYDFFFKSSMIDDNLYSNIDFFGTRGNARQSQTAHDESILLKTPRKEEAVRRNEGRRDIRCSAFFYRFAKTS